MKKLFSTILFIIIILTACTPVSTPISTSTTAPSSTPDPTNTPQPTVTITQTFTPEPRATSTKIPSITPFPELLPENVDLPIEKGITSFIYKHCYVFADDNNDGLLDRFHAGDLLYFYTDFSGIDNEIEYKVLAPIEGRIIYSNLINDKVGWEIRIETPYLFEGKKVFYDIVHADRAVVGLYEGEYVQKGQPILIVNSLRNNGRFEKVIDIAFRNGIRGPQPGTKGVFHPYSYIDPSIFFEDDFSRAISAGVNINFENCTGNPVREEFSMKPNP